jgi:two-component sensor histidine kinase
MMAGTDAERIAELEQDNERLRRLLEQRDASGELRHRLRSTLALLRAIVRKSAETRRDLPGYVAHLEDRLDATIRAQAQADQHGEVDLRTLLVDETFQYGISEGEKLLLSGPEVRLQPRAGQILALAFHELAVNAVEHGAVVMDGGRIDVSWHLVATGPGKQMLLTWAEPGASLGAVAPRAGFGTEVLTRMLAYDLKAKTDIVFGLTGLRCTISLPLAVHIGRVVAG